MAAIPDAAGDRNVTQAYMAELNATIRGFAPVVAPKIPEQAKNDIVTAVESEIARAVEAVESEIARAVEDTNKSFNTHVQEVKGLAEKLGNDFAEEKRRELEAKDAILAKKDEELESAQERLKKFNASTIAGAHAIYELKVLVGTEKLTPKEWVFFITKILIEFYVSIVEPLAAAYRKDWLKWSGLALAIVLFLMTTVEIAFYCIQEKVIQSGRVRMRKIRWIVDVYGFIMSTIAIVLFAVSFHFPSALHIALYACTFSICMLLENCVRQFTKKQRSYEVDLGRAGAAGGDA